MKKRLIKLLMQKGFGVECATIAADYLLANGVLVPPCKVGDTVYVKWRLTRGDKYGIYPAKVYALRWDTKKNNFRVCVKGDFKIYAYGGTYTHYYSAAFTWDNVSKTVFLTRAEAEKALSEKCGDTHLKMQEKCENQGENPQKNV